MCLTEAAERPDILFLGDVYTFY